MFAGCGCVAPIVGYATQEIAGGKLSCVALQFADVGGDGDVASIANLNTSGLTPGEYNTMTTEAPCIMIFDGVSNYDYYFYISDAYKGDEEVTAWADAYGNAADVAKVVGTGFWLRIPEGTCDTGTLTESGEVNLAASTTIDIASGLTLAGNPYPTAITMSKIVTSGLTPGEYDTMTTEAPCIMIFDGVSNYDYYFYISDAYKGDEEVTAWADAYGNAVTGTIAETGKAFWARSTTAGTLTFSL